MGRSLHPTWPAVSKQRTAIQIQSKRLRHGKHPVQYVQYMQLRPAPCNCANHLSWHKHTRKLNSHTVHAPCTQHTW